MSYLFWKDGSMRVPPCSSCGSSMTGEEQEVVDNDPKIRKIYVNCMSCGKKDYVGTFEHLGGHNFKKR